MGEVDREFEELFDAEFPAVVRAAFVVCQDLGRAEDLAQEAFLELLRHWRRVSRYDRPGAWVRRVAIRKAVQVTKREARRSWFERRAATATVSASPEPLPCLTTAFGRRCAHCRLNSAPWSHSSTTKTFPSRTWPTCCDVRCRRSRCICIVRERPCGLVSREWTGCHERPRRRHSARRPPAAGPARGPNSRPRRDCSLRPPAKPPAASAHHSHELSPSRSPLSPRFTR